MGSFSADSGNVRLDTSHYTANFAFDEVYSGIGVTVSALGLTGSAAGNYVVSPLPTGLIADIDEPQTLNASANALLGSLRGRTVLAWAATGGGMPPRRNGAPTPRAAVRW